MCESCMYLFLSLLSLLGLQAILSSVFRKGGHRNGITSVFFFMFFRCFLFSFALFSFRLLFFFLICLVFVSVSFRFCHFFPFFSFFFLFLPFFSVAFRFSVFLFFRCLPFSDSFSQTTTSKIEQKYTETHRNSFLCTPPKNCCSQL